MSVENRPSPPAAPGGWQRTTGSQRRAKQPTHQDPRRRACPELVTSSSAAMKASDFASVWVRCVGPVKRWCMWTPDRPTAASPRRVRRAPPWWNSTRQFPSLPLALATPASNSSTTSIPTLSSSSFLTAIARLVDGWLEKAEAELAGRPDHAVVCGRKRERFRDRCVYHRLCDMEWDTPVGEADACGGDAPCASRRFVRSAASAPA